MRRYVALIISCIKLIAVRPYAYPNPQAVSCKIMKWWEDHTDTEKSLRKKQRTWILDPWNNSETKKLPVDNFTSVFFPLTPFLNTTRGCGQFPPFCGDKIPFQVAAQVESAVERAKQMPQVGVGDGCSSLGFSRGLLPVWAMKNGCFTYF